MTPSAWCRTGLRCSLLVMLAAACETPAAPALIDRDSDREFDGGSRIQDQPLSPVQIENLALLGEVWGFVKYHHPRVAGGQVNWDYELFRVMPAVLQAGDRATAAARISGWLTKLGDPGPCSPCAAPPANVHLSPPVEWIHDRMRLGDDLSGQLSRVYSTRPWRDEQFYVSATPAAPQPDFSREARYQNLTLPDAGFRLLALYRFWNIILYWFPYRNLIEEDWRQVLAEFIPRFMSATTTEEYRIVLMLLIARVHDTHAYLLPNLAMEPPRGELQLPVVVRFVEGRAVVSGYSHSSLGPATGLRLGDVIETLDGERVDALVADWRPYYSASNEAARLRDIARNLTRGDGITVGVGVARGDAAFELLVERAPISQLDQNAWRRHDLPGEAFQWLSEEVAYVKLSSAVSVSTTEYAQRAAEAGVLVIDIRNRINQGSSLGRYLVDRPTEFARYTRIDLSNPGAIVWDPDPATVTPAEPRFRGSVVILVDENTQSSGEFHAMFFRAGPNAIVVGSTTAGADGNVSPTPLPGNLDTRISGLGVFYPDGTPTQRIGIVPDLVVRPTIQGIREGRDEVLEAAVSHALGREFRLGDQALAR